MHEFHKSYSNTEQFFHFLQCEMVFDVAEALPIKK